MKFPTCAGRFSKRQSHECAGPGSARAKLASTALGVAPIGCATSEVVAGFRDRSASLHLRRAAALAGAAGPTGGSSRCQVTAEPVSLDPMHPLSGKQMIAKFFQRFEDRNPGRKRARAQLLLLRRTGFRSARLAVEPRTSPMNSAGGKAMTSFRSCPRCSRTSARGRRRCGSTTPM